MTSFVYYVAASLDGFIDDEVHSLQWLLDVPTDDGPDPQSFMSVVGVQVMGSHTYEWLVAHEDLLAQPQRWQEYFGAMPTRVFSSRDLPVPVGADVEVLRGSVSDHIDDLRALAGGLHVWIVGGENSPGNSSMQAPSIAWRCPLLRYFLVRVSRCYPDSYRRAA